MNFSAVARSARRGKRDNCRDSAGEVVHTAKASKLVDHTSRNAARGSAAAVVALVRTVCRHQQGPHDRGAAHWRRFNAGLEEVQARLARSVVPAQVLQEHLLLALRQEASISHTQRVSDQSARAIAVLWRLHVSGLLPLSRLLEANEMFPFSFFAGHRHSGGDSQRGGKLGECCEDCTDFIVHDMRTLAMKSAGEGDHHSYHHQGGASRRNTACSKLSNTEAEDPGVEEETALVSRVAKHLFDIGYQKLPAGLECLAVEGTTTVASSSGRGHTGDVLSCRAARRVLDRLCCGPEMFGHGTCSSALARLRTCLAVLVAIDPVVESASPLQSDPHSGVEGNTDLLACAAAGATTESIPNNVALAGTNKEERTSAFLAMQLRLLVENASGVSALQGHTNGTGISMLETDIAAAGGAFNILTDIMLHFPPAQFIEVLRSTCRRAIGLVADATGTNRYKPLLQWETLAPIVRAAALAHTQEVPPAIALLGTELAAAAINLVPSGDGNGHRIAGCDRQQGVLVLSAALRLVAQADVCSQGARRSNNEGGSYARWIRSCFGVASSGEEIVAAQDPAKPDVRQCQAGQGAQNAVSDQCWQESELHGSEAVREATEKQHAMDILMEALCLSVPSDPAFVLEVHKDVLKTRLRDKFSVQVRDFLDLVVTRLSDLNGQDNARRRLSNTAGSGDPHGVVLARARNIVGDGDGDPSSREVGFFLHQFKQTGEVPLALKTAILWQPKSWVKYRNVLLAPPAERIVMPDASGNVSPAREGATKEAIGSGENGLRVEVSLKYRRLLVQQLAKETLISAKDYEGFRQAFTEYLQGQRKRDTAPSEALDKSDGVTVAAQQLSLLEAKLVSRNREGHGAVKGTVKTNGDGASVQERLAILLQEYLPRALLLELCMQDDDSIPCRAPSATNEPATRRERQLGLQPRPGWFAHSALLLTQILEEWERGLRPGGTSLTPAFSKNTSPEDVAEAILNSVHCCVAAVGVSLGQDVGVPLLPRSPPPSQAPNATGTTDSVKQGPGGERKSSEKEEEKESCLGDKPCTDRETAHLCVPVVQAFRCIGEVVSIAARVAEVGEALARRCCSLLTNPSRLDPKQVLSLAHILASLPHSSYPRVERLMTDLIAKALRATFAGDEETSLEEVAHVGVLYLQSTVLLHRLVWTCATGEVGDTVSTSSRRASGVHPSTATQGGGGISNREVPSSLHEESVGFAPVVLLEFLWWIDRRVSVAQSMVPVQRHGAPFALELVVLSRLLRSVMAHPRVEGALKLAFPSRGVAAPPLERLIALEVAVSIEKDFCGPLAKLAFLQNIILGQLQRGQDSHLQCGSGSADHSHSEGANNLQQDIGSRYASVDRSHSRDEMSDVASDVKTVWKECAACLFRAASLCDAARRRVNQDARQRESRTWRSAGDDEAACDQEFGVRSSWRDVEKLTENSANAEGAQTVLDSILQVMGKLCNFEATAGSIRWTEKKNAGAHLGQRHCAGTAGEGKDGRRASQLLAEALALLEGPTETSQGGTSSVLVLLAEAAMPAIGASEGHEKVIDSLRLVWDRWFCKARPLGYGAVVRLTQMALMWCGGHQCQSSEREGCPVVHMLEDLPFLAVEMVKVWPELARTLTPVLGVPGGVPGPLALDAWACHLSTLHIVRRELGEELARGGLESLPPSGVLPAKGNPGRGEAKYGEDERVPLGPASNRAQALEGKRKKLYKQGRTQGCKSSADKYTEHKAGVGACSQNDVCADAASLSKARPALPKRTAELGRRRPREAATALPRTCAELIVGTLDSAVAVLTKSLKKRPRQVSVPMEEAKRAKMASSASSESTDTLAWHGDSRVAGMPSGVGFQSCNLDWFDPPSSSAWAMKLLEPLYGPGSDNFPPASLRTLLEVLIKTLGVRRACEMGKVGRERVREGELIEDGQSLVVSLVVAVLGYAPSLVSHLAENPCLVSSTATITPAERAGRSLAVLDCLKRLSGETTEIVVSTGSVTEPSSWLTVVLSHYAAACLSLSDVRRDSKVGDKTHTFLNGRAWADVVAFVHTHVRDVAPRELRLIPTARVLQEVDPVLKQYF